MQEIIDLIKLALEKWWNPIWWTGELSWNFEFVEVATSFGRRFHLFLLQDGLMYHATKQFLMKDEKLKEVLGEKFDRLIELIEIQEKSDL